MNRALRYVASVGVVLLLGSQVGCAQLFNAPLVVLDGSGASTCAPADHRGRAGFGISALENVSDFSVEIVAAELVGAEGTELIAVELTPIDDPDSHIVGLDYDELGPRPSSLPASVAAGEGRVLLTGIRLTGQERGSAEAVRLTYRSPSGATGTLDTRIRLEVEPSGVACGQVDAR